MTLSKGSETTDLGRHSPKPQEMQQPAPAPSGKSNPDSHLPRSRLYDTDDRRSSDTIIHNSHQSEPPFAPPGLRELFNGGISASSKDKGISRRINLSKDKGNDRRNNLSGGNSIPKSKVIRSHIKSNTPPPPPPKTPADRSRLPTTPANGYSESFLGQRLPARVKPGVV